MSIARVRTVFTGVAGTPWYSNIYFMDDGATPIGTLAIGWVADYWNAHKPGITSQVSWSVLSEVVTLDEATGDLESVYTGTSSPNTGSASGQPLPWATQVLARQGTAGIVHNRRVRGRIFIPGFTEDSTTTGRVPSATQTAVAAAGTALVAASTSLWVVWSRPFAGTEDNPARDGTRWQVTGNSCWDQFAVQRSRRD